MVHVSTLVSLLASSAFVAALPTEIAERADSCTFSGSSGAAAVAKGKGSCSTITLSSLVVPAGKTLDLTGLKSGTKVCFRFFLLWYRWLIVLGHLPGYHYLWLWRMVWSSYLSLWHKHCCFRSIWQRHWWRWIPLVGRTGNQRWKDQAQSMSIRITSFRRTCWHRI